MKENLKFRVNKTCISPHLFLLAVLTKLDNRGKQTYLFCDNSKVGLAAINPPKPKGISNLFKFIQICKKLARKTEQNKSHVTPVSRPAINLSK